MIDLSIVVLNWNVRDLLDRCLASLRSDRCTFEVIVVDNASQDDSVAMVREKYPHVIVIANTENRGFTGGNNQGIAASQGRYVMVLNPDTEVLGDAIDQLLAYLDQHSDVGALGPQLLNPDRSIQSSRRRFPTLTTAFFESTWLQSLAPRGILAHYYLDDVLPDHPHEVDWLNGACTIFRREVLDQVGLYDEQNFFMYSEELDLCRRVKEAGWKIMYLPEAQVVHYVGKSSDQAAAARHIYFQTSKVHYFRKWHGAFQANCLRLFLLSQYAWQIVLESVKRLLGSKRDLRKQRVKVYGQVIRTGLK
ncbi:MAG TPA: glycosyltransferase family 2 protein [Anaerolineae bacterium]|nr:glycosyltransferase family 2 protein [Anaerolineae bacterium]